MRRVGVRWRRTWLSLAVSAAGVGLLNGCDGSGPLAPSGRQPVGFGGPASAATQLTGTWRRTLFFFDDFGFAHANETTWQFSSDGTAVRSVVTRNFTLGLADVFVTVARWSVTGTRVIIDYVSPEPGHVELEFRFDTGQLVLAGEFYARVGN